MRKPFVLSLFLPLILLAIVPLPASAADTPPVVATAELDFTLIFSIAGSTDAAYTAAFGATSIQGLTNGEFIRFNGNFTPAKYANVKFYQPSSVNDASVTACVQKALMVAAVQLQLTPSSDGRNAGLVMKVVGDVRLNENNGGYDGGRNLTIIEVRSLKSLACEASIYFPQ